MFPRSGPVEVAHPGGDSESEPGGPVVEHHQPPHRFAVAHGLVLTHFRDPEAHASVALGLRGRGLLVIGHGFFVSIVSEQERLLDRRRHSNTLRKTRIDSVLGRPPLRCREEKGEQTVEEQNETRRPIVGPENGTDVEVRVIGLSTERLGEAARLLARCFYTNPNVVDLFPDERASSCALIGEVLHRLLV